MSDFLVDFKNNDNSHTYLLKLREKYKSELKQFTAKIDGYNFREIFTQIKMINDETDLYDREIYKPKFPSEKDMTQNNTRENYEKIIPIVKQPLKNQINTALNTHSSKNASPLKEEAKYHYNTNNGEITMENELGTLNEKVNDNIQQLYDTLYKNTIKNTKSNKQINNSEANYNESQKYFINLNLSKRDKNQYEFRNISKEDRKGLI